MVKENTKQYNEKFAWIAKIQVKKLLSAFDGEPVKLYFVGGCVRDSIIDKSFQDIDIATDTLASDIVRILSEKGIKTYPSGIKYGSITAKIDGVVFHITTFRKDIETDGRHAVVEFTKDIEVDSERRDFTINSIYYDIANNEVIDFHGGIEDLKNGVIRFIGNPQVRVKEDYLRILRFFRFLAHFGKGQPLEEHIKACVDNFDKIKNISKQRITSEMLHLLSANKVFVALKIMKECGMLSVLDMDLPIRMEDLDNAEDRFIIINRKKNENFILNREQSTMIHYLNVKDPLELVSIKEKHRLRLMKLFSYLGLLNHHKVLMLLPKCPVDIAMVQRAGFTADDVQKVLRQSRHWCISQMLNGKTPNREDVLFLLKHAKVASAS